MSIPKAKLQELAVFYRRYLMDDIAAFWEPRTQDREYGGYITYFDQKGNVAGYDKNMWALGRHTYVFALMYRLIDRNDRWLELSKCGRDFMVQHAHAGGGQWHYLMARDGQVLNAEPSLFADMFALMGLCEYATISGNDQDRKLIELTWSRIERCIGQPDFNEWHHFDMDPAYFWMAQVMIVISAADAARPLLGDDPVSKCVDYCIQQTHDLFAKPEHRMVFEMVQRDGRIVDTPKGRLTCPGHVLEMVWFVIHETLRRGDNALVKAATDWGDWAYEKGHDTKYGGILGFVDYDGNKPKAPEIISPFGERWDDKIWWIHSEALYTTLLTAILTDDETRFRRFLGLHTFTQQHFADQHFGEWYAYLHRNGVPRDPDKGNWAKSAFHIMRNMILIVRLLENGRPAGYV